LTPTIDQLKQYLESQGISLPDFILELLLEQLAAVQDCLSQHYPPATALLIQLYLLSLLAMAQGDRYISSQSAPSGASRSFRFKADGDRWRAQLNLLSGLDKFNCVGELIPDNPFESNAGLWISTGGCKR